MAVDLTVGVPVYNGERYLNAALASLSAQTLHDCIFLLSNNGSSDGTAAIMEEWAAKDARFKIITRTETLPVMEHFNAVLAAAETPFFMFAAYDDQWSPNFCADLRDLLVADPQAGLAVGTIVQTLPDSSDIRELPPHTPKAGSDRTTRAIHWLRHGQAAWFYGLYRRDQLILALKRMQDLFPHVWGLDFVVLADFFFGDKIVAAPTARFYQLQTGLSATRYRPKTRRTKARLLRDFLKACYPPLKAAGGTPWQRLRLHLALLDFAHRRAVKFRRLLTNRT